jgi:hypothetical protein
MFDKPGFIRLVGSLLLAALIAISVVGLVRWGSFEPVPPAAGRFVLGLCALSSLFGLGVLWKPRSS